MLSSRKNIYHMFGQGDKKRDFIRKLCCLMADFESLDRTEVYRKYIRVRGNGLDKNNYDDYAIMRKWLESEYTYDVYSDKQYKIEAISCYDLYSCQMVKFAIENILNGTLPGVESIMDFAGGIGLTSTHLAYSLPHVQVSYCDLQSDFFEYILKRSRIYQNNLSLINHYDGSKPFDMIVFLEAAEHFRNPTRFMRETFKILPKYFVISHTFTSPAPGHFDYYFDEDEKTKLVGRQMSKYFNQFIKSLGYKKYLSGFNSVPTIWKRV